MFGSKESKIEKAIAKKNAAPVLKLLNDKDAALVLKAIAALGQIPGDESYNELVALLRSPKAEIRAAAVTALGEFGDPKGRTHLSYVEKKDTDAVVKEAAIKAMAKLQSKD